MSNAPVKDITSCDCVKLGCGTCINHEKRIERLEFDLTTLRSQLFFPNESEIARNTENALRFALDNQGSGSSSQSFNGNSGPTQLPQAGRKVDQQTASGNAKASQGHSALPSQPMGRASEPKIPARTMVPARGREETKTGQKNDRPALRASSKEFVVKKSVEGTEAIDSIVRGIQRPKYSSTCYINAAIQALFHVQGFSNFLESNSFNKDRHPLLLLLQKLHRHCRSTQGRESVNGPLSNREIIDCLNSKGTSINPKRQGDSTEFFERLVEEVAHETRNGTGWRGRADVKELLRANIVCTVACKECGQGDIVDYTHTTVHLEHPGRPGRYDDLKEST